jgi:hypothetical protein
MALCDGPHVELPLSQGLVAIVDKEDAEREEIGGVKWHADKSLHTFYAVRNVFVGETRTKRSLHRAIMYDTPVDVTVDHVDRDGLNNCRANLRRATYSQNSRNRRLTVRNVSGYIGVSYAKRKRKWVGCLSVQKGLHRSTLYYGYFDDPESAARARDAAAIEHYGEFASLNFPIDTPAAQAS